MDTDIVAPRQFSLIAVSEIGQKEQARVDLLGTVWQSRKRLEDRLLHQPGFSNDIMRLA
jgi:hypothetical protein